MTEQRKRMMDAWGVATLEGRCQRAEHRLARAERVRQLEVKLSDKEQEAKLQAEVDALETLIRHGRAPVGSVAQLEELRKELAAVQRRILREPTGAPAIDNALTRHMLSRKSVAPTAGTSMAQYMRARKAGVQ